MATYPALSSEDIHKNQAFWQQRSMGSGVFFGRLLEEGEGHIRIFYNHQSYVIKIGNKEAAAPIPLGSIVKIDYLEASHADQSIYLKQAKVSLLSPSLDAPLKTAFSVETHIKWQSFLQEIRNFFLEKDFLEFRSPTLVSSPGIEEHIDIFKTEFRRGSNRKTMYLPTSPEFHLKKALSLGWNKIFELKDCFRNDEGSPIHQPEFLMLEWYRAYSNLEFILQDTKDLILYLSKKVLKTSVEFDIRTVSDVFKEHLDFDLKVSTSKQELTGLLQQHGLYFQDHDSWDDLYFRIFIEKIEPYLGGKRPLILTKYPASQAALARHTEDGWADRFEVYWKGIELANAFHELNDPSEQRRRFNEINEKRKLATREEIPIDEEFLQALDSGMPPSGGIALGVERLFMCFYDIKDIGELRGFII